LWAATRRSGEYSGLNIVHLIGVGAARDARLRSDGWFKGLDAFLKSLEADTGLTLAARSIDQIAKSAEASKAAFLEAAHRGGIEVYREPLTQAPVWPACAAEWGRGPGFKHRVADRLETWLDGQSELKETLETLTTNLWEQTVISPLMRLVEEGAPEADIIASNVIHLPRRRTS